MKKLFLAILFLSLSCLCSARTTSFDEYWDLDRINAYLFELQEEHPEIIEVEEMGITSEGRTLFGVRIVNATMLEQQNYTMPIIFITAGASARDWIATMAAIDVRNFLFNFFSYLLHFLFFLDYS